MWLRRWGTAVAVLVLSGTLAGAGASPDAAYALPGARPAQPTPGSSFDGQPSGWLELDAGPAGQAYQLTPGGRAEWAVDVHVRGEPASALEVWLEPGPVAPEDQVLRDHLSVELQACSQPWVDGACAVGHQSLLGSTPLADAEGERVELLEPGSGDSTGMYVLLTAALAGDAPPEVQGTRTHIVLGFHGAGDDLGGAGSGGDDGSSNSAGPGGAGPGGAGPGGPAPGDAASSGAGSGGDGPSGAAPGLGSQGPPSGLLADTGTKLAGFALLGALAVGAGFVLSGLLGGRALRGAKA